MNRKKIALIGGKIEKQSKKKEKESKEDENESKEGEYEIGRAHV